MRTRAGTEVIIVTDKWPSDRWQGASKDGVGKMRRKLSLRCWSWQAGEEDEVGCVRKD